MQIASALGDHVRLVDAFLPHRPDSVDDFTVTEIRTSATGPKDEVVNRKNPDQLAGFIDDREFIQDYRRARWEVVEQGYARVQQTTPAAASILLKLMVDPATPASGRIRAALGTFALAREALDLDIETRVAALEQAAELSKQGR